MSQTRFIPEVANRQSFIVLDGRRRVYGGLPLEESATEYTEQLLVRLPESRQLAVCPLCDFCHRACEMKTGLLFPGHGSPRILHDLVRHSAMEESAFCRTVVSLLNMRHESDDEPARSFAFCALTDQMNRIVIEELILEFKLYLE
jgi:hypothetical protein